MADERSTYLNFPQILQQCIDHLRRVQGAIETLRERDLDERTAEMLTKIELEERNMVAAMERKQEDADPEYGDTHMQYSVELPERLPPLPEPATSETLTTWILDLNEPLQERFRELRQTSPTDELTEEFRGLEQLVVNADKLITRSYEGLRDL